MYRALLVCNSRFPQDPTRLPELLGPAQDGPLLKDALTDSSSGMFQDADVQLLVDASAIEVVAAAERFFSGADPDDTLLFYFSGHGRRSFGELFLCTSNTNLDSPYATAVSERTLSSIISASHAQVKIIVLDCCYSGGFKGSDRVADELKGKGRYVITATSATQEAEDAGADGGPSPFTRALVEGLLTEAVDRDRDSFIDLDDLFAHLMHIKFIGHQPHRNFDGAGDPSIARRAFSGIAALNAGANLDADDFTDSDFAVTEFLDRTAKSAALSDNRIKTFREGLRDNAAAEHPAGMTSEEFLRRAGLIRGGHPTVAGVLLFGENPTALYPDAMVRCARFHGASKTDPIASVDLHGTIPELIVQARDFVANSSSVGERPSAVSAYSEPVSRFPMIAVREVIANAVVHRDYTRRDACVHVHVFDDRVEAISPGDWGADLADRIGEIPLGTLPQHSRPRNFRLARVLAWAKLVESVGAGLPRAILDCRVAGAPEPVVDRFHGTVTVTIYPSTAETMHTIQAIEAEAGSGSLRIINGSDHRWHTYSSSADGLAPIAQVVAPPNLSNLPIRPKRLVGRSRELRYLDNALARPGCIATIQGLGGIGKTTLVAEWVATRTEEQRFSPVWWIKAHNRAALEFGLADFASAMQPEVARMLSAAQLADRGLQWLASHDGWLLILDDVADPRDIESVIARVPEPGGRIVITSRLSAGWHTVANVHHLSELSAAEAFDLVSGLVTAAGARDLDGTAELCEALGYLPLAVEQAAAYLAQNPATTPRDYLELLNLYPAAMHARGAVTTDPERTIARIWGVTLDNAASVEPFAAELLAILAWWAPSGILPVMVNRLADPPTVNAAVGVLVAYSLIRSDPDGGSISVHPLVQAVARTPNHDGRYRASVSIDNARERAAQALADALPVDWEDPATWSRWRELLPHAEAFTACALADTDTDTTAGTLHAVAGFLGSQGLSARAIPLFTRALTDQQRVLGNDHPDTLRSRNDLAGALASAGQLEAAISLFEQALTDQQRVLGNDHPDTLRSRNNLAGALASAGQLEAAISLFEQALTDQQRVLGNDHPDTLRSRNNLAGALASAGQLEAAISLFEQALTDQQRVLGNDHPDTLRSRNDLAGALASAGQLEAAISLFEQALTDQQRVLGNDHPDTLRSRNNLAGALASAGQLEAAISLFEQVYGDCARVLGSDHPLTKQVHSNLSSANAGQQGSTPTIPQNSAIPPAEASAVMHQASSERFSGMAPSIVVAAVAAAVSTGAVTGLADNVEQALVDAYAALKGVLRRRYASVDIAIVEARPTSSYRRDVLEAELVEVGVEGDDELREAAEQILRVVHEYAPQAAELAGMRLTRVNAGELAITDINASERNTQDRKVVGSLVKRNFEVEGKPPRSR